MRMKYEFTLEKQMCVKCPLLNFWLSICQATDNRVDDYRVIPDWCPLIDCDHDLTLLEQKNYSSNVEMRDI